MNTEPKSIIGITIGPIYEVMKSAVKARELWCGSYIFSWYMKQFHEKISADKEKFSVITPFIDEEQLDNKPGKGGDATNTSQTIADKDQKKSRAGIYPDHIIAASSLEVRQAYEAIREMNEILKFKLVDRIAGIINKNDTVLYENTNRIVQDYLQPKFLAIPYPTKKEEKNTASIVGTVDSYLLTLENSRTFRLGESIDTCSRCRILPKVTEALVPYEEEKGPQRLCPFCYFKVFHYENPEFREVIGVRQFPHTGQIATREFRAMNPGKYDSILDAHRKNGVNEFEETDFKIYATECGIDEVKPYHKYFAVVTADGDSITELARTFTAKEDKAADETEKVIDEKEKGTLSKRMFNFSMKVIELTKEYHGELIYCGGDDVLALMPVAVNDYKKSLTVNKDASQAALKPDDVESGKEGMKTVFHYAKALSEAFMKEVDKELNKSSLSVGIKIVYYKHPLSFALNGSYDELHEAKEKQGKDTLSVSLEQHSGQSTHIAFQFKDADVMKGFMDLLSGMLGGEILVPHNMLHKLMLLKKILLQTPPARLHAFFENYFNEEFHETQNGLKLLQERLEEAFNKENLQPEEKEKILTGLISQLRFIEFLRGED